MASKQKSISLPENLHELVDELNLNLSKFTQEKLREEYVNDTNLTSFGKDVGESRVVIEIWSDNAEEKHKIKDFLRKKINSLDKQLEIQNNSKKIKDK